MNFKNNLVCIHILSLVKDELPKWVTHGLIWRPPTLGSLLTAYPYKSKKKIYYSWISWSKSTLGMNDSSCVLFLGHSFMRTFDPLTYTQSSYLPWTYLKYNAKIIAIDTPFKKGEIRTKLSLAHSNTKIHLGTCCQFFHYGLVIVPRNDTPQLFAFFPKLSIPLSVLLLLFHN